MKGNLILDSNDSKLKSFKTFYETSETSWRSHCQLVSFQGSGAGGQKRNRVYSGVRLILKEGIKGESCDYREVKRNEKEALDRLRLNWAYEFYKLSEIEPGIYFSNFDGRMSLSNPLYPCFVYYCLIMIFQNKGDIKIISESLNLSPSKLIRQWGRDKRLFTKINEIRKSFELHILKNG